MSLGVGTRIRALPAATRLIEPHRAKNESDFWLQGTFAIATVQLELEKLLAVHYS